jgi:multidrug resistance protein MdtO
VAARLDGVATRLQGGAAGRRVAGPSPLAGGNAELLTALKMTALLKLQPPDTRDRLRDLVVLSYGLTMTAEALAADGAVSRPEPGLAARIQALGAAVRSMPRLVTRAETPLVAEGVQPARDLAEQMEALVGSMERVVAGGPRADLGPAPKAENKGSGFFVPDAFTAPRHVRHAVKGTAAVLICYLTIVLLDWSKIATCIITCFVVGLPSAGETTQKLTLRIIGACVGALLGLATIVIVLPNTTDIAGLSLLIALGALPAAWIAVGPPTVAYIGFQIAFAFFLCVLQGSSPAFDLTVARDRIIGVLFGDAVMFLIFANVYPASILGRLKGDVAALLGKCRSAVAAISAAQPVAARAGAVAEAEALLDRIGAEAAAFGYETRRSRDARLQSHATRLSLAALHGLVGQIARLAAYPAPPDASDDALALEGDCAAIDAHLGALAARFMGAERGDRADTDPIAPVPGSDPVVAGRAAAVLAVRGGIARSAAALARYGRLLRARGHADA